MLIGFLVVVAVLGVIAAAGWYVHNTTDYSFEDLNIPDKDIYY